MSFKIYVNGQDLSNFVSFSFQRSMTNLCGQLSIVWANSVPRNLHFRLQDSIKLFYKNIALFNGRIEKIAISVDRGQHQATTTCFDLTYDLVVNSLDGSLGFNPPISLVDIFKNVLSFYGITGVSVIDNSKTTFGSAEQKQKEASDSGSGKQDQDTQYDDPAQFAGPNDTIASQAGDKAWEFLQKLLQKRQLIATTNGQGNIVITRAGTTFLNATLQIREPDTDNSINNNLLSYSYTEDGSGLYNKYVVLSQLNPASMDTETSNDNVASQEGIAVDEGIIKTRQSYETTDTSQDNLTLKQRAAWRKSFARANSVKVDVTLNGFETASGDIYQPNTLIRVFDDYGAIHGDYMLIREVNLTYSRDDGVTSDLSLTFPNSFTVDQGTKFNRGNIATTINS